MSDPSINKRRKYTDGVDSEEKNCRLFIPRQQISLFFFSLSLSLSEELEILHCPRAFSNEVFDEQQRLVDDHCHFNNKRIHPCACLIERKVSQRQHVEVPLQLRVSSLMPLLENDVL